jgi:hypothetical protein
LGNVILLASVRIDNSSSTVNHVGGHLGDKIVCFLTY